MYDVFAIYELISRELISCKVDLVRIDFVELIRWELSS